jgi:3'(2'), 5'-bisphosphate nucleotidase
VPTDLRVRDRPLAAFALEMSVAVRAARAGGAAVLRHYGTSACTTKTDRSPVTAADMASNEAVCGVLWECFPGDPVLSEESSDSPARLAADRVWIVDPLDGTREFLAGNGEFAVMVGLAVEGKARVGAVYLPEPDVLFVAGCGSGAWMERGATRTPLRAPLREGPLRLVGSRSHPEELVERIREGLGISDVRPSGSVGVKCGLIALGERDLYVHPVSHLKEWDTCAPEVVLREAGGTVGDCTGATLRYNKPEPRQPHGILACGPGVREHVLGFIEPLYRAALQE